MSIHYSSMLSQSRADTYSRLLFVDDHVAVREALAAVFAAEGDFEVVGQASTCAEAREYRGKIDVAIIDLRLPDGRGSELIPMLRRTRPPTQTLVLTGVDERAWLAEAVDRGAAAVLNKNLPLHDVVSAVRRLRSGETLLPEREVFALLREAGENRARTREEAAGLALLTSREREVLAALAAGLDSRQIAERLVISPRTERNHVAHILAKLDVRSQLQAVLVALRHGAVTLEEPLREAELGGC